ncbi:MAG TPA: CAP domain-containing protein [Acidimicrobiia bacterium]|nr:CAP domain-containing protein [Acidimicrobiia bacterium]
MRKVVYGLILAFGLSLFPATGAHADTVSDEASFVSKINDLRGGLGLPALQVNANLVAKARGWAAGMAAAGKIWHSTLSDGITADWEKLGENVGMGGSVDGLHAAFVASPHHYENLVDADFGYVGIGIAMNGDTMYVAEEFMQLMPPKAATVAAPVTNLVSVPATPTTTAPRPAAPKPPAPKPVVPKPAAVPAAPPVTPAAASAPPAPPAPVAAPAAPPRAPSDLLISVLERLHTFDS